MKNYTITQLSLIFSSIFSILVASLLVLANYNESLQYILLLAVPLLFFIFFFSIKFILTISLETVKNNKDNLLKENEVTNKTDARSEKEGAVLAKSQIKEIERLKDLEKYRKEFVGNVSHELKTPIFNIQGYILTLLEGAIDDEKINKLYLQRTEKSIDRMISIVEDLESITKLESGELTLKFEVFDIVKLVEDVFDMEQRHANEQKITIEIKDKPSQPILVNADKKRITEVITNLVVNSIKYGKKKGSLKVSLHENGDKTIVEVSDNGIGIDENNLPRIFERFYRVDKSRSREQGGTGLGLSIVKHIIEAHEQTIEVKSLIDKGTTFTFTLDKAK